MKYRIQFLGMTEEFPALLPTLEKRKEILLFLRDGFDYVIKVDEWTGREWQPYDVEAFLERLAIMLAPAR